MSDSKHVNPASSHGGALTHGPGHRRHLEARKEDPEHANEAIAYAELPSHETRLTHGPSGIGP
jgi:hypothetical protein